VPSVSSMTFFVKVLFAAPERSAAWLAGTHHTNTGHPVIMTSAEDQSKYLENHAFAVCFTCIAAASQGLGGLIAVLGMSEFGSSVAHLMSFSTGVMIYLSFMDIMFDTTSKIGESWASFSFFIGMVLFLMLEICLPEVEGTQVAELLGLNWAASPQKPVTTTLGGKEMSGEAISDNHGQPKKENQRVLEEQRQHASTLRQRRCAVDINVTSHQTPPPSPRRAVSPVRSVPTPASPERRPVDPLSDNLPMLARQRSPPPSEKRKSFEQKGELALTERRKKSMAFSVLCDLNPGFRPSILPIAAPY
jgi:hypothetical protein